MIIFTMLPECVNKRGCNKKGGNVKVTDKNHFAGNATEMHAKQILAVGIM